MATLAAEARLPVVYPCVALRGYGRAVHHASTFGHGVIYLYVHILMMQSQVPVLYPSGHSPSCR